MDINYIKDGEYLTGFIDENNVGVLNRPVHELSEQVKQIINYLKNRNIQVQEPKNVQWTSTNW